MTTAVGSSVPTVLAELKALFLATFAGDTDPVSVVYGPRDADTEVADRLVSLLGVKGTNEPDSLADDGGSFTERYSVLFVCSCDLEGPDDEAMQVAAEAALALWRRCRAALRTAPGPRQISAAASAVGVQKAVAAADFELAEAASKTGRTAAVRGSVDVIAQVTT